MRERLPSLLLDMRRARRRGPAAIARRQHDRLAAMVAFARVYSPCYRELYQHLPQRVDDPTLLPVTTKQQMMARFDDWVTDREITLAAARAFVANPDLIGEPFLGQYLAATTSGTTGTPGIFLLDERYLAVNAALQLRIFTSWLTASEIIRILGRGMRTAQVFATNGHFIGIAGATRYRRTNRWLAKRYRVFSVQAPLPELVARLNRFRPAVLIGYATVIALLAAEQEAGRLRIAPILVIPTAEGLAEREYRRIATAFGAKVRDLYGATESGYAAYGCTSGWLHVNSDWAVLEPVDADFCSVPPGTLSHTVLLSNLANRVQPILRYDLGDRVVQRQDPCPCGNPLPAIHVQGRAADVLTFPSARGEPVVIPPLALELDQVPGIEVVQIVQSAPTTLRVRLRPTAGADANRVWQAVVSDLSALLAAHGLGHVTIERDEEPPRASAGGKYRQFIPLAPPEAG